MLPRSAASRERRPRSRTAANAAAITPGQRGAGVAAHHQRAAGIQGYRPLQNPPQPLAAPRFGR